MFDECNYDNFKWVKHILIPSCFFIIEQNCTLAWIKIKSSYRQAKTWDLSEQQEMKGEFEIECK
jgi:hypothetical protein